MKNLLTVLFSILMFLGLSCSSDKKEQEEAVKSEDTTEETAATENEETESKDDDTDFEEEGTLSEEDVKMASENSDPLMMDEATNTATAEDGSTNSMQDPATGATYANQGNFTGQTTDGTMGHAPMNPMNPMAAAGQAAPKHVGGSFHYTVRKGDSLSKISKRVYGSIAEWKTILRDNPQITNPNLIFPGDQIKVMIRDQETLAYANQNAPAPTMQHAHHGQANQAGSVTWTVRKGDSLSKIAKAHFGSYKAWKTIWNQNRGTVPNPNRIEVGQVLTFSTHAHQY